MSAPADPHSHGNDDIRFEPTDVAARPVVLSVAGLAVFTLVFTFLAHLTFYGLAAREKAASAPASPLAEQYAAKQPPEPRLQLDPKLDLETLLAAEAKTLSTLGWVDRAGGVVQVPIERAMEMLLAKGLPAHQGAVPRKMQAHEGHAPDQMAEGAGAPDWQNAEGEAGHGGHNEHGEHGGHAAAPAGAHGH